VDSKSREVSAGDGNGLSGQIGGVVGREERHDSCDLFGFADSADGRGSDWRRKWAKEDIPFERNNAFDLLERRFVTPKRFREFGANNARTDGIGADAEGGACFQTQ
jgi:hypothetical protein